MLYMVLTTTYKYYILYSHQFLGFLAESPRPQLRRCRKSFSRRSTPHYRAYCAFFLLAGKHFGEVILPD